MLELSKEAVNRGAFCLDLIKSWLVIPFMKLALLLVRFMQRSSNIKNQFR